MAKAIESFKYDLNQKEIFWLMSQNNNIYSVFSIPSSSRNIFRSVFKTGLKIG